MKMSIREAFEKYDYIWINYIFITKCRVCGKYFETIDEEYSFEGNLNDFEEWLTHYNVIDLDYDEIEQYEGDERKFALYRNDSDEGLCEQCENSDEQELGDYYKQIASTMCKYQRIAQIYQKWNEVNGFSYNQAMSKIGEVLEDDEAAQAAGE